MSSWMKYWIDRGWNISVFGYIFFILMMILCQQSFGKDTKMDNEVNIWKLFREEFKDGEDVIIVHENCKLYGGKLKAYENRITVAGKEYSWNEVVFIAHDGFPCRSLHTCLSNEQLGEIENEDSIILMRKLLTRKPPERIIVKEKVVTKTVFEPSTPTHRSGGGFGCPYEMENVRMQILNPFNGLKADYEETLLCQSKDGAVGMLWCIDDEIIEFYN